MDAAHSKAVDGVRSEVADEGADRDRGLAEHSQRLEVGSIDRERGAVAAGRRRTGDGSANEAGGVDTRKKMSSAQDGPDRVRARAVVDLEREERSVVDHGVTSDDASHVEERDELSADVSKRKQTEKGSTRGPTGL